MKKIKDERDEKKVQQARKAELMSQRQEFEIQLEQLRKDAFKNQD